MVFIMTKGMKLYPRSPLAIRLRAVSVLLEIRGEEHNEERKTTGASERDYERDVRANTASLTCKRHMLRRSHAHAHTCFPFITTDLRAKRDFSESTRASKHLDTVYELT